MKITERVRNFAGGFSAGAIGYLCAVVALWIGYWLGLNPDAANDDTVSTIVTILTAPAAIILCAVVIIGIIAGIGALAAAIKKR